MGSPTYAGRAHADAGVRRAAMGRGWRRSLAGLLMLSALALGGAAPRPSVRLVAVIMPIEYGIGTARGDAQPQPTAGRDQADEGQGGERGHGLGPRQSDGRHV